MVAEVKNPDSVDPLHGCSIISLLPRTSRDFDKTAALEQGDMEFFQTCLKSVTIECPDKHLKQAKTILSSASELQNSEFPCLMLSDDKENLIPGKGKDRPQERRPALGRKRARFSLKPDTSQPALDENVHLNIDQLQDPEEFFAAFEKFENAKIELQKQWGGISTDITIHNTSMTARNRRPGILGKTVGYKHRHSLVLVDSDEAVLSSQEQFKTDVPSQSNKSLIIEMTDQHADSKEKELASHGRVDGIQRKDSLAKEGKKISSLLDEMLTINCTEIDEDGAVTFLQDRLQIKPFNLDKLCLPRLDNVRRSNLKASVEQLGGPRKALSDIHNKLRRVSSKTTTECQQVANSSMFPFGSPNPSKSPFSAMAVLKKRLPLMEPPVNPFSFDGIDTSPASHSSQVEGIEKDDVFPNNDYDPNDANDTTSAENNEQKLSFTGPLQSLLLKEDNLVGSNMVSKKTLTEKNSACPHDMPMDDGSNINADINIRSIGSDSDKHKVPPHFDYVHNDACNSDRTFVKLNEKKLSFSQRLQSPVLLKDNIADSDMVLGKLVAEILVSADINMDDSSNRVNMGMDITLSESDGGKHKVSPNGDYDYNVQSPMLEEYHTSGSNMLSKKLVTETSASLPDMAMNDNSNRANSDTDIRSSGSDGNVKDTREEAAAPVQPELDFEGLPKENMDYISHLDQFDVVAGEHLPKDGYSESQDIFPEKTNETHQESFGISMHERSYPKTPLHTGMKRKDISHQKSLSGKLVTENLACPSEVSMNKNSSRLNTDMDIRSNGSDDVENQESSKVSMNEGSKQKKPPRNRSKKKQVSNRKSLTGKLAMEESSCLPEMSIDENSKRSNSEMDTRSSGSDAVQDQTHQEYSRVSTNSGSNKDGPPCNGRKKKEISNRKSLAGAGTVFDGESGRRKCTRYRTEPLDFWKGECFVYGRVHQTMSTVIGVRRYESPASAKGKGKKRKRPPFKVESLVSDEFKDLLEKAALH